MSTIIHSRVQNRVALRLDKMVDLPLGIKEARQEGDAVEVWPGRNEIDDAFWKKWCEQNKDGMLIKHFDIEVPDEATTTPLPEKELHT